MSHPALPKHIMLDVFAGAYITVIRCKRCKRRVEIPCLIPALDADYWAMRDRFVAKHRTCRKGKTP